MKNKEHLIEVINKIPVVSITTLSSLLELTKQQIKMHLSDEESEIKTFGHIIIKKQKNENYEVFLSERQAYYFINTFSDQSKVTYVLRKLLNDFFYVQSKLLKKNQQKQINHHAKMIAKLRNNF